MKKRPIPTCLHFPSVFPTLTIHVAVEGSPTINHPNPRDPGRNLLFGLLAFQNNFIDRRALVAAFDAWTTDKSQPLGRVLVSKGVLSDELHALIEGLVSAHRSRDWSRLISPSTITSLPGALPR